MIIAVIIFAVIIFVVMKLAVIIFAVKTTFTGFCKIAVILFVGSPHTIHRRRDVRGGRDARAHARVHADRTKGRGKVRFTSTTVQIQIG